MTTSSEQTPAICDPLATVDAAVHELVNEPELRERASATLREIARSAAGAVSPSAAQGASLFATLAEILAVGDEAEVEQFPQIVSFLQEGVAVLRSALDDQPGADRQIESMVEDASRRWGEWLDLVVDREPPEGSCWTGEDDPDETGIDPPSDEEVSLILSVIPELDAGTEEVPGRQSPEPASPTTIAEPFAPNEVATLPQMPPRVVRPDSLEGELLEAYSDDAQRCLATIEASLLAFEQQPAERSHLRQMCRELHTLKGASASVGIGALAEYLHRVEEFVQARCESDDASIDAEPLLAVVDVVRNQLVELESPAPGSSELRVSERGKSAGPRGDSIAHSADETVRVKASQLDRLMDMLAELVMLRNGRESRIADLNRLNEELIRSATRLRGEGEEYVGGTRSSHAVNPLREVANDVLEIARSQREVCDCFSAENLAVSRFIRTFRQELTEVRRLPISGLFGRLRRAVQDAARTERKQVRFELVGEHAGLERSLQERLYEPLLHIVRNAVSHGIETDAQRSSAGKEPGGTITLEARGTSNLLILEVRDDGRGLDYDALRRRGVERGFLSPDQAVSREELAQLIFQPGFSTRESANAVAGRGVGMDVVADALSRMHAWVEVESRPGEGTQIHLSIPLRTVIEHAMVFRRAGQLFGVPMQVVRSAVDSETTEREPAFDEMVECDELMGWGGDDSPRYRLTLATGRKAGLESDAGSPKARSNHNAHIALGVDEIVGPEEVVIRPLPPLLRLQSLVTGVTLAGTGELLLLLDGQHLTELTKGKTPRPTRPVSKGADAEPAKRVLVVDDSISARRCLSRAIRRAGLEVVEASDGREALEELRHGEFAAVFSDLEMPGVGGFDLLREMATDEASQIPVTIVSSRQEEQFSLEARKLGAVAYLTKPVTEARVCEELQRLGLAKATRGEG